MSNIWKAKADAIAKRCPNGYHKDGDGNCVDANGNYYQGKGMQQYGEDMKINPNDYEGAEREYLLRESKIYSNLKSKLGQMKLNRDSFKVKGIKHDDMEMGKYVIVCSDIPDATYSKNSKKIDADIESVLSELEKVSGFTVDSDFYDDTLVFTLTDDSFDASTKKSKNVKKNVYGKIYDKVEYTGKDAQELYEKVATEGKYLGWLDYFPVGIYQDFEYGGNYYRFITEENAPVGGGTTELGWKCNPNYYSTLPPVRKSRKNGEVSTKKSKMKKSYDTEYFNNKLREYIRQFCYDKHLDYGYVEPNNGGWDIRIDPYDNMGMEQPIYDYLKGWFKFVEPTDNFNEYHCVDEMLSTEDWYVDKSTKKSKIEYDYDGIYAIPRTDADSIYHVVGMNVSPSFASLTDDELGIFDSNFEPRIITSFDSFEEARQWIDQNQDRTKRVVGIRESKRNDIGYGFGNMVWTVKSTKKSKNVKKSKISKDFGSPMHEAFVAHAKMMAGGHNFDWGSGYVECTLSDDYYYNYKLGGIRIKMVYDDSQFKFVISKGAISAETPYVQFTEPENIGENLESILSQLAFDPDFVPQRGMWSAKKSYTPDYQDFRSMVKSIKNTGNHNKVFKE